MNELIYDMILVLLGVFFGQIVGKIFIYKVLHPYVVAPYLMRKKDRQERCNHK